MRRFPRRSAIAVVTALLAAGCAETSPAEIAAVEQALGRDLVRDTAFTLPDPGDVALDPGVGVLDRTGDRPDVRPTPCPFERDDLGEVRCGTVDLPGRGVDPSFEVTIAFARFSAAGSADVVRDDPVVYLHGGPGGAILDDVDVWYDSIVAPFVDTRDVILYDQRGGGRSTTLPRCHEVADAAARFHSTAEPHDALAPEFLDGLSACATKVADVTADPTAFSSRINAEDLLDLLWALGVRQYNLYGSSYGTRLAQTVLRDSPEGVRSVILAGVYPIEANLMGSVPSSLEQALDAVFAGCAADDRCASALPDGWAALEDLVTSLDAEPLAVEIPVTVDTTETVLLDGTDLLNALHGLLYVGADAADIPDLLIDTADGDLGRLRRLARNSVFDYVDVATFLLVQCADEGPFTTAEDLARPLDHEFLRAVDLAPAINGADSLAICAAWDTDAADADENDPVTWTAPTLIFAGAVDPITPPSWAEQLAERLPRARYVHRADMAHDADEGWCAVDLMTAFVEQPDLLLDTACAASPTVLPVPDRAARFRPPLELVDASLDLDDDGTFVDLRLPPWWEDRRDGAHIRWRDLDVNDPLAVVVRPPGSTFDVTSLLGYEWLDVDWTPAPRTGTPIGWVREVIETTAGDLVRLRNTTTGVDVTLRLGPDDDADLERTVLVPVAESIGDGT